MIFYIYIYMELGLTSIVKKCFSFDIPSYILDHFSWKYLMGG